MSSGSPPPDPALEAAVRELAELVSLAKIGNDIQRSIHVLMSGGAPEAGGTKTGVSGRPQAKPAEPTKITPDGLPQARPAASAPGGGGGGRGSGGVSADELRKALEPKPQRNYVQRQMDRMGRWASKGTARGQGIEKRLRAAKKAVAAAIRNPQRTIARAKKGLIGMAEGVAQRAKERGVGGSIGQAVGTGAAAVTTLVSGFLKARDAVDKWTEGAMASAAKLKEVSGSMAAVMAERDIQQMMRDVKRGEATAGSANELMSAESKRKTEENRIGIVVDNASNKVLAVLNDIATLLLRPIADIAERLARFIPDSKTVEPGGWAGAMPDVMAQSRAVDRAGLDLMAQARAAAAAGMAVGPAGARPPGALP